MLSPLNCDDWHFSHPMPRNRQIRVSGEVRRCTGLIIEGVGCSAALGQLCEIEGDGLSFYAEVIGFNDGVLYLMPMKTITQLSVGARITPKQTSSSLPLGKHLLGRVLDGLGNPLDGLSLPNGHHEQSPPMDLNPLKRQPINLALDVGVKAINACLTVGKGQRLGIFAGSGVGKSVTLGMMAKGTQAQVVVVALIGERGREVQEFIDHILPDNARQQTVVIAAPADTSPLLRRKACENALKIAAYFRDCGSDVLLLFDSLTRFAQAQREIALALGEPPATKGYPPSVFAKLPSLVEMAGNSESKGTLTTFFTVLTEGDDLQDPIADAARAILDGHIVLSRELADAGHYPAIDVERSVSRVMPSVVSDAHLRWALQFRQWLSLQRQYRELLAMGAYKMGTDKKIDLALNKTDVMMAFLQQTQTAHVALDESVKQLQSIIELL